VSRNLVSLVAVAAVLAGCATVDKATMEAARVDAPEGEFAAAEFADVSAMPPTGDWVAAFEDPALRPLIVEALDHNRNLGAAYARLEAAREAAEAARAGLLPTLGSQFNF